MTTTSSPHPWLVRPAPHPDAALRLFCFPYAGGGSAIYHYWPKGLPSTIEVCALRLPGRETRISETPFTRLTSLTHALSDVLLPDLDRPFAFFGHSLGGLISFELVNVLRQQQRPLPVHLYISASRPPQLAPTTAVHQLPTPDFIDHLRGLLGTPEEVLNNQDMMQLLLPCIRADFAMSETYTYTPQAALDCPITAFGGWQDHLVDHDAINAWRAHTHGRFKLLMLAGGHFYIHSERSTLLELLARELMPYLPPQRKPGL